jgi:hypothetical protein
VIRAPLVATLAVFPMGTLLAHSVGYGLGGHEHVGISHSYLAPLWVPFAAAAIAGIALAVSRRASTPPLRTLLMSQTLLFVVQESAERWHGGPDLESLVSSDAVRWGLAAQALVAVGIVALISLCNATVVALHLLFRRPVVHGTAGTGHRLPSRPRARDSQPLRRWQERAPPQPA